MRIKVQSADFDPQTEIAQMHSGAAAGAEVTFIGLVREHSDNSQILALHIEHYPGMTERELERIGAEAAARFGILDALIIHRYGPLQPTDRIVQVSVWSQHRAAAFDACRYLIDALKTRAPFWKREITPAGERWVTDCPGCRTGQAHLHG